MTPKTIKALLGSIQKWIGVAEGTVINRGTKNCPLCQLFYDRPRRVKCEGCPVADHTGNRDCMNTPYWDFMWSLGGNVEFTADTPERRKHALREVKFLASLLPGSV